MRIGLALVAVSAIAVAVSAQKPASPTTQQPTFRSGVDLVQIDVVVLDKDGHPVRGLKASDFTLLDRKKPQMISAFDEVTHERMAAPAPGPRLLHAPKLDVATNQIPPTDRLIVMVLDDLHIFRGRTDRTKEIARKIVDSLGPQSSMSVLFTSGRHSLEVTRDRAEILAAIDTFVGWPLVRRPSPGLEKPPGGGPGGAMDDVPNRHTPSDMDPAPPSQPVRTQPPGSPSNDAEGLQHFFDDMTLHKTVEDASRLLAGSVSGRKALVLLSEGTGNDLNGFYQSPITPCEVRSRTNPCFHQVSLLQAMEAMQKSNVALYIFDPRGAVSDQAVNLECSPATPGGWTDPCVGRTTGGTHNWIRFAQDGFKITAAGAGGFAVTNTDDFDAGVARLTEEIDHFYLLGFSPTDPKGGGFRPVTVTVNRPGVTLHFRQGYEGSAPKAAKNTDALVALSTGVLPRTDLPLRLTATPLSAASVMSAGKKATRVVAVLEASVPRADLTGADQQIHGELRYSVLAANIVDGKVVQDMANTVTISSATPSTSTMGDTISFEMPVELTLPPGRYQLRASAVSPALSRGGSVYLNVEVPDYAKTPLALGGPIVGTTETSRVTLASGTQASAALPFTPALDREFARSGSLRVYCPISRINPLTSVHATVEVLDAGDRVVLSSDRTIAAGDNQPLDAVLSLKDLSPGPYRLRVAVTDGTNADRREVGIIVK